MYRKSSFSSRVHSTREPACSILSINVAVHYYCYLLITEKPVVSANTFMSVYIYISAGYVYIALYYIYMPSNYSIFQKSH